MNLKNVDYNKLKKDNTKDVLVEMIRERNVELLNLKHVGSSADAKNKKIKELEAEILKLKTEKKDAISEIKTIHNQDINNLKKIHKDELIALSKSKTENSNVLFTKLESQNSVFKMKILFYEGKVNELIKIINDYMSVQSGSLNLGKNVIENAVKEYRKFKELEKKANENKVEKPDEKINPKFKIT